MSSRLIVPVYLVIDESARMGSYRSDLVHGLTRMIDALRTDPRFLGGLRISILGFSDAVHERLPLGDVHGVTSAPNLVMRGTANYGAVFGDLLARVPADVQTLKTAGHRVFRPVIFFITSGRPAEATAWRTPHRQLTDHAATPTAPVIVAYGVGGTPADLMLQIASQPDYAFIAPTGSTAPPANLVARPRAHGHTSHPLDRRSRHRGTRHGPARHSPARNCLASRK